MKHIKLSQIIYLIIIILFITSLAMMGLLDINKVLLSGSRLAQFFSELFPPRLDILKPIFIAVLETIEIAFTGTILGFILAIPLAFFGNRILFGRRIVYAVRFIIAMIRTVPSILFGVIFVIAFGLGKAAGTLAVALYTTGYLAKLLYEAFEAVDSDVIEAVRSTGCSGLQLFRYAIIPESANTIISQVLFMFEYNIRASTIMGFVGAGGVGFYMLGYIQMLQYRHLLTTFIVILIVVMLIDFISLKIRSKILCSSAKR